MGYENSTKKVNDMLTLARTGATVWWRREGFHQEPFRGVEPRWHVLTGRFTHHNRPTMQTADDPVWTALCGYDRAFDERILLEFPSLRKTAPKKATRCRKCVEALPAYQVDVAAQLAGPLIEPETATKTHEESPQ